MYEVVVRWDLPRLPGVFVRGVAGFSGRKDCPCDERYEVPRTLGARRVDVGYRVNGFSRPRHTRPSQTTDAWQNPWPKQNDIHEESVFAPYGLY